jgi:hypothetical protein
VIELGLGAQEALAAGERGTVMAVFRKAAYVRMPAGLVALTTWDVPAGPIHARGALARRRLAAGDRVTVGIAGATVWRGELPADAAGALEVLATAPASALEAYPSQVARARAALYRGDLNAAVDAIAGLGPGLTPAGDDALAGILLVAQDRRAAIEAADRARTNDIARAFLAWAARGQSIEPVHRLLAGGGKPALADLLRFGHSSGADLAFGLRLGMPGRIATGV